ncbi:MAG: glycosyltransferase family 2 protein [Candidatus Gracilibacteria bacterium]
MQATSEENIVSSSSSKQEVFQKTTHVKDITSEKREGKIVYIIIPMFNEARNIIPVVENCRRAGFAHLLIVDDGSYDNTRALAEKCGVEIISHIINRGQGAAVQTGILAALERGAEIIVTMDGDQQFNPSNIPGIINPLLKKEADIVIGSRFKQKNNIPFTRRFFNYIANIITFFLSGIWLSDSQSGFKGFSKKAAEQIDIHTSGYEFCTEIVREIASLKLKHIEVPVDVYYTEESLRKGQNFAQGIKTAAKLLVRSLMY